MIERTDTPSNRARAVELDTEHAQRVPGAEQGGAPTPQVKLKERQKFFEEAFQQDMEQYLSTGYLQIAERRGPIGSMSSMEVNVDMLEQMDLMDMSDHEALDVFLHSGGEDNSGTLACRRCGVLHHRDQSPGAHPGRAAPQALLPLLHLHRLSQPGHRGRGGRGGRRGRRGDGAGRRWGCWGIRGRSEEEETAPRGGDPG
ncbi:dystrobrevin binding protein 1b isoform X2 [Trematomus bernacchii]|uniref:dystrobrevin binding protein 1b isoform X2 n=1 Tax=Trematomus bernacchii TaxID=40690 RepID=UPI00146E7CD1|nr:dystrobrevin binding protein 1b isoform X2 [Trematomus bernacchii]